MQRKTQDVREAVQDVLQELMGRNKNVYFIVSDTGNQFPGLETAFPDQFIDVGIAEQNMISVAAGMAYSGKIAFTSTLAEMTTMRVIEQIRLDCCYPGVNVNILGQGRGLAYGFLGPTHHAPEDIGMLRALPNMTVLLPADAMEGKKMILAAAEYPGPTYIGLGRGADPVVYDTDYKFQIGKAVTLTEGKDVTLIAAGSMVVPTLDAAEILKKDGIRARVINMHTIKPLDHAAIIKAAKETGAIVTVEDHNVLTGLGSAVAEVVVENYLVPMKKIGIPDIYCAIGYFDELIAKYKMDAPNIAKATKKLLKKKP
jgi:transketolase